MSNMIQFAVLGLTSGGVYALLALGLIVIFRATGAVNFAHAGIAVAAGYVMIYLDSIGIPTWFCVALSILAGLVFGLLVQLLVMRPLRHASPLTRAIASLGVLVIVQSSCQLKFGSNARSVRSYLPQNGFRFLGAHLTVDYVIILFVAIVLTCGLSLVYRRTKLGLATAALSEDEGSLQALGWSSSLLAQANWALAGTLAAVAGVLSAPLVGVSLASMEILLIPSLAAALFGGLRSFGLAFLGAMFIGVIQSELTLYGHKPALSSFPNLSDAVPFLVIIVVLIVKGKSIPARDFIGARLPSLGTGRLRLALVAPIFAAAVVVIQLVATVEWVVAITSCLIAGVVLLSLTLLTGYAGQLSLAQVSIAGLGSLAAAQLVAKAGWPLPLAALTGVAVSIPVGVIVGLPAVRTRGVTLAVVTLGLAEALNAVVFSSVNITGGNAGVSVGSPSLFGIAVDETDFPRRYSLLALAFFVALGLGVRNIRQSGVGRKLIAVRGNERAAASLGINVAGAKLYAFVVSSAIATVGGLLIAFRYPNALFDNFDPFQSVNYVVQSTIGGVGYIPGALAGTSTEPSGVGNKVLTNLGFGTWLLLVGGILLLLTLILNPDGIAGGIAQQLSRWQPVKVENGLAQKRAQRRQVSIAEASTGKNLSRLEPSELSVRELTVRFGAVTAVDGVTFTLHSGEVLGVIGPNGAGKTTLVDAITGYVDAQGSVTMDGHELQRLSVHRRSKLGITRSFQSLELFEELTVLENLLVASERRGIWHWGTCLFWPGRKKLGRATSVVVDELDLHSSLGASPADLPYGRRRLLAIARAVASGPRILLLDEPAAGLSDVDRSELRHLLRRLAEDWGLAVLLIEHDVDLVMSVSDRVVAMEFGKVLAIGVPSDIRRHPEVLRSYLGGEGPQLDDELGHTLDLSRSETTL
jgi:ABC-type branched-subunit amino acid transport system ATPase component/ABC-type branched-subunit amino acid transport system permease subunit